MTGADFLATSPIIAVYAASVVVMLGIAVHRSHDLSFGLAVLGLVAALALLPLVSGLTPRQVTPLLVVDAFGVLYTALVLGAGLGVVLLSRGYLNCRRCQPDELYILVLLGSAGAAVMVTSQHFASFYLGLEVLSVSLYALVGYRCTSRRSTEAAVKYLVLAAAAAAFLLFGMALVYSQTGTLQFAEIAAAGSGVLGSGITLAGFALILAGLGFKLSVAPFHMWTPDVYEGAPAPVTAYIATVSKAAVLALLLRYLPAGDGSAFGALRLSVALIAVASMFVGNLLALRQQRLKRVLAYSSIAHLGYVLVAWLAGGAAAVESVTVYLVGYVAATLGAFGVITVLSARPGDHELDDLEEYRGLFASHPTLAATLSLMLLSLAGIPLTAGFVGKLYVVVTGLRAGLWWLVGALVVNSALGLVYYLRVINTMVRSGSEPPGTDRAPCACWLGPVVLAALAVLVVAVGIWPEPLIEVVHAAIP